MCVGDADSVVAAVIRLAHKNRFQKVRGVITPASPRGRNPICRCDTEVTVSFVLYDTAATRVGKSGGADFLTLGQPPSLLAVMAPTLEVIGRYPPPSDARVQALMAAPCVSLVCTHAPHRDRGRACHVSALVISAGTGATPVFGLSI